MGSAAVRAGCSQEGRPQRSVFTQTRVCATSASTSPTVQQPCTHMWRHTSRPASSRTRCTGPSSSSGRRWCRLLGNEAGADGVGGMGGGRWVCAHAALPPALLPSSRASRNSGGSGVRSGATSRRHKPAAACGVANTASTAPGHHPPLGSLSVQEEEGEPPLAPPEEGWEGPPKLRTTAEDPGRASGMSSHCGRGRAGSWNGGCQLSNQWLPAARPFSMEMKRLRSWESGV